MGREIRYNAFYPLNYHFGDKRFATSEAAYGTALYFYIPVVKYMLGLAFTLFDFNVMGWAKGEKLTRTRM
jgi:hypothetical protein